MRGCLTAYSASSDVHFQMPGLGGGYIAEHRWADAARASELTVDVLDGGPASSVELRAAQTQLRRPSSTSGASSGRRASSEQILKSMAPTHFSVVTIH